MKDYFDRYKLWSEYFLLRKHNISISYFSRFLPFMAKSDHGAQGMVGDSTTDMPDIERTGVM